MRFVLKILAAIVIAMTLAAIVIIMADNLIPVADNEEIINTTQEAVLEETRPPEIITQSETVIQPEQATLPEPKNAVLIFGGDVYLSDYVLNAYDKAGGISGIVDSTMLEEMETADIFMVNEEFPFSTRGIKETDKQYTFRVSPERVNILSELGIDIVSLANNHGLDYGKEGLEDTFSTLDGAEIKYVGAGTDIGRAEELITYDVGSKTIGFLAATRVVPKSNWGAGKTTGMFMTYDPSLLIEQIKSSESKCDFLVVFLHWGIERDTSPQEYQRTLAKQFIDAGADIVIGSHPHVLQGIEYYNGKPIIYSLGNIIFGSSIPKTALLKLELAKDVNLSLIPAVSSAGYTRAVTEKNAQNEFYEYITGLSSNALVDENGKISEIK